MKRRCKVDPAKFGFKHVIVHFGMFDYELVCLVGPRKRLVDFLRIQNDDPHYDPEFNNPTALHFTRRGYAPILWLPRRPRTPREYGSLTHELVHTLRAMLVDWAGIPLNYDTDEIFAYAAGHAATKILEGLK